MRTPRRRTPIKASQWTADSTRDGDEESLKSATGRAGAGGSSIRALGPIVLVALLSTLLAPMASAAPITPDHPHTVAAYDFESGAQGWTSQGSVNQWQLGTPSTGPGSAHSGTKAWGTNLHGNYANNAIMWLDSPQVRLPVGPVTLEFWHHVSLHPDYGIAQVQVLNGSAGWETIASYTGLMHYGTGWHNVTLDISDYGNKIVRFRFLLTTGKGLPLPGWYVDDVSVVARPVPRVESPEAPDPRVTRPGSPLYDPTAADKVDLNAGLVAVKHTRTTYNEEAYGFSMTYSVIEVRVLFDTYRVDAYALRLGDRMTLVAASGTRAVIVEADEEETEATLMLAHDDRRTAAAPTLLPLP